MAVWLRLGVLMPLLPLVYADSEADPAKNLRPLLAQALLRLIASPAIRAGLPPQGTKEASSAPSSDLSSETIAEGI